MLNKHTTPRRYAFLPDGQQTNFFRYSPPDYADLQAYHIVLTEAVCFR